MWRADEKFTGMGHFTLDLVRAVALALKEQVGGEPDRAAYEALFAAALGTPGGTKLSEFVKLPDYIPRVAERLRGRVDSDAVTMLDLPPGSRVGDAERSRVFWAYVKAYGRYGNAPDAEVARLLHEDPSIVDGRAREDLLGLAAMAFARGRDADVPDVLAAFGLEYLGRAYAPPASVEGVLPDVVSAGRHWVAGAGPGVVNLSRAAVPRGERAAPWTVKGTGTGTAKEAEAPYAVEARGVPGRPGWLSVHLGGTEFEVPARVFVELLANDPALLDRDLDAPVVLVIPELGVHCPGLPGLVKQRLGRSVFSTEAGVDFSARDAAGNALVTLRSTGRVPNPTLADWKCVEPIDPPDPGWKWGAEPRVVAWDSRVFGEAHFRRAGWKRREPEYWRLPV